MLQKFYQRYVAPRQSDEDTRNREFVLNVLLVGTFLVALLAQLALLLSLALGNDVGMRIISVALMGFVLWGIYYLSRAGNYLPAATLFIGLYSVVAILVASRWGVAMPIAVLLFGLIIVLAGILIGALYSLVAVVGVGVAIVCIKLAEAAGITDTNWSWTSDPTNAGTIVGFVFLFGIIAVVSWLFNYRMERSLHRAERAEIALKRQKGQLERTVAERTQQLQEAQLEKVQELYRFAELGQLSTALMHDLANHLATLTIDIENLESETRSHMLRRAKRSMHYIDNMVAEVRDQLRGKTKSKIFTVANEVTVVTTILRHKAGQVGVTVRWQPPEKSLRVRGDVLRFRQLMANIISNAIDACAGHAGNKEVLVSVTQEDRNIVVRVEDWGKGISKADLPKIFEPFYGTKKGGLGLGLFIARQIAHDHFGGDITIDTAQDHTVVAVTLRAYVAGA